MDVVPYFTGGIVLAVCYIKFVPSEFGKLADEPEPDGEPAEKMDLVEKVDESELERRQCEDEARRKRIADLKAKLSPEALEALEELKALSRQPGFNTDLKLLSALFCVMLLSVVVIVLVAVTIGDMSKVTRFATDSWDSITTFASSGRTEL